MKQIYIQTTVKSQNRQVIIDTLAGNCIFIHKLNPILALVSGHPSVGGSGGRFCKGPPGQSRSPGVGSGLFPDHPPDEIVTPDRVQNPVWGKEIGQPVFLCKLFAKAKGINSHLAGEPFGNTINTEVQTINKYQIFTNIKFLLS